MFYDGLFRVAKVWIYLSREKKVFTLFNNQGGENKRGGASKVPELINEEEGIKEEGDIFWKTWREYVTGINEEDGNIQEINCT